MKASKRIERKMIERKMLIMKKMVFFNLLLILNFGFAQVGIGNSNPRGLLDINSSLTGNSDAGIVLPTSSDVNTIKNPQTSKSSDIAGTIFYDTSLGCIRYMRNDKTWSDCLLDTKQLKSPPLKGISGLIDSDGSTLGGSGFTSRKISTGVFRITFNDPFTKVPSVAANVYSGSSGTNWNSLDNVVFRTITNTHFDYTTGDDKGVTADRPITFVVVVNE